MSCVEIKEIHLDKRCGKDQDFIFEEIKCPENILNNIVLSHKADSNMTNVTFSPLLVAVLIYVDKQK